MEFMRKDTRFHIGICPKTHPGYEGVSREFIESAKDRLTARRARAQTILQQARRTNEQARRVNDEADSVIAQAQQAAPRPAHPSKD